MTIILMALILFSEIMSESNIKDKVGIISIYSQRKQIDYIEKHNISLFLFGQKKFLDLFQVRLDLPSGIAKGKLILSDLMVNFTINPSEILMKPCFSLGFEFPTGTSPATSGRFTISPKLSLMQELTENISLNFLILGNFSPDKSEKRYNTLFPHTFNEILGFIGIRTGLKSISLQPAIGLIYENFKYLGFQVQAEVITSVSDNFEISVVSFLNIGERTIRKGYGAGLSLNYSF